MKTKPDHTLAKALDHTYTHVYTIKNNANPTRVKT